MTFEELKDKALSLPLEPGVYLMQDKSGQIIYVGKAKKLKNRVSQYFQNTASHTPKTRRMVSQIDHFDVIVAASEFEALVLECSLIKRHMPKYNILLKDDKGYPYLRVDMRDEYPTMELVSRVMGDGASYFGPYGGRFVTQRVIDTIRLTLKLPGCSKKFPRDLGKERPCLNYHMNNCDAWCQLSRSPAEYRARMEQAMLLLQGKYTELADSLREKMLAAAEALDFEQAAMLRDRLRAVESLGQKQLVTAGSMANTDVIGYYQSEAKACFAVLHYVDGNLLDKEYEILQPADSEEDAISTLVKQYYLARGAAPKVILLPKPMEDAALLKSYSIRIFKKKVHIRTPQRGDNVRLVDLCAEKRERGSRARHHKGRARRRNAGAPAKACWGWIRRFTGWNPTTFQTSRVRIWSRRWSFSSTEDRASRITSASKSKVWTIKNDYAAMQQVLRRRLTHFKNGDAGFDERPDALLIDGGIEHANAVLRVLNELGLAIPTFGMVKDNRHRTRALVTPQGHEISISAIPAVFSLIGTIQEETHRFAITLSPYAPQPPRPGLEAKRFPVSGRSGARRCSRRSSPCAPSKTQA